MISKNIEQCPFKKLWRIFNQKCENCVYYSAITEDIYEIGEPLSREIVIGRKCDLGHSLAKNKYRMLCEHFKRRI